MKKALFLLLAVLLVQYKCDDKTCGGFASGVGDCENLKFDEEDEEEYYKCCFIENEYKYNGQKTTEKYCNPVTKDFYDDIKDRIKDYEKAQKEEGYSDIDVSIDCDSNYIMISLLSLILLFL